MAWSRGGRHIFSSCPCLSKGLGHRAPAASNPLLSHGRPLPPGQQTPDSAQVSSQGTGNDVTSPRSHSQGDTAAPQSRKLFTFQLPKHTAQSNSQARPRGRGSGQGARSLLRPGWSWEVDAWFPSRTDTKKAIPKQLPVGGSCLPLSAQQKAREVCAPSYRTPTLPAHRLCQTSGGGET